MDSHASEGTRPQRVIGLMQLLLGPAPQSARRSRCVISKFPSQKSGSRQTTVGGNNPGPGCPLGFPLSYSQIPWHSALLGATSEAWSFPKLDYGALSLRPCWLTSVSCKQSHTSTDVSAGEFLLHT